MAVIEIGYWDLTETKRQMLNAAFKENDEMCVRLSNTFFSDVIEQDDWDTIEFEEGSRWS